MNEHGKYTLMKNSKAVNQPFRSPLRSVQSLQKQSTDISEALMTIDLKTPPNALITPEKRIARQSNRSSKKVCVEEDAATESKMIDNKDIRAIEKRIQSKRQQIGHLKLQLVYKKKHESQDLVKLTERWLHGCREALIQFQKDLSISSGCSVSMSEILSQLCIPPDLIGYSVEDDDFVGAIIEMI